MIFRVVQMRTISWMFQCTGIEALSKPSAHPEKHNKPVVCFTFSIGTHGTMYPTGRIVKKCEKFVGPYEFEFHCDHNIWDYGVQSKNLDICNMSDAGKPELTVITKRYQGDKSLIPVQEVQMGTTRSCSVEFFKNESFALFPAKIWALRIQDCHVKS